MAQKFVMPIKPMATDIDENGHVNNAVYVRWLQEIATAHWRAEATPEWEATYLWIVSRHEIDYLKQSVLNEELTAHSWGENPRGARFDRRIDIFGPDGDLRIRASTTWVLMDRELMRPARVPRAMVGCFILQD